ncbi:hypothetical protein [Microcoleus sp. FACHB-831]|nr:hypothetical protein [Microcoleus sp. FACHB-831]
MVSQSNYRKLRSSAQAASRFINYPEETWFPQRLTFSVPHFASTN